MPIELFANTGVGTLQTSLNNTDAAGTSRTISYIQTSGQFPVPTNGQFRILIGAEILIVMSGGGGTWTVSRGAESTTISAHNVGDTITHIASAGAFSNMMAYATTYDLFDGIKGTLSDGTLLYCEAPRSFQWNSGIAHVATNTNTAMTITILKNGSTAATMVFGSSTLTSGSLSTPVSFATGDIIDIELAGSGINAATNLTYRLTGATI